MPLDYRRFNGPDDSVSYKRFTGDYLKSYDELYSELIDENGHRKDGREMEQARTMCMFCMYFLITCLFSNKKISMLINCF